MTDRIPSLALREIRREFSNKTVVLAVLGAGLILGLSGPFGTIERMGTMLRIAYWLAIAFGTYGIGVGAGALVYQISSGKRGVVQILLASLCAGLAVSLFLLAFNWAFVGYLPSGRFETLAFVAEVTAIAAIITTGIALARGDRAEAPLEVREAAILERLPFDKRGALVCLSVTDHYVDVVTSKGQEMILMRFADAMREVGSVEGVQVHRSHWVALGQVVSVERAGDGANLTMSTGQTIPVSRSNMPAIREAGLLPKR